jgi:D-threo-aldose 1-dehydrogenase
MTEGMQNFFKMAVPIKFPRVVFGTTTLGNLFVLPSDADKSKLVDAWLQAIPTHVSSTPVVNSPVAIDSAGKYGAGLALEVLGRELKRIAVDPKDVLISNKLGWRRVPLRAAEPTFEPGVWFGLKHDAVQDISYQGILRCWEEGCELLGDYKAEMLSVHDPDEYLAAANDASDRKRRLDDILAAYDALYDLQKQGKAQAIGIGCKDWRVVRELDRLCKFDWVMLANSFTVMSHPKELLDLMDSLASRHIPIINSAVLHGGFLSRGFLSRGLLSRDSLGDHSSNQTEYFDYRPMNPHEPSDAAKLAWRERFLSVCQSHSVSPFDVAVSYGLSHPGIRSIALSTSRHDRVPQLVDAATKRIPESVWIAMVDNGLLEELPFRPTSSS